jgi:hypothetical protein
MILSSARTFALGDCMFAFYFAEKFAAVDTGMMVTGAYVGAVDGYVCLKEGVPNKAIFRVALGAAIAAWGWFDMTAVAWLVVRHVLEKHGYGLRRKRACGKWMPDPDLGHREQLRKGDHYKRN